MQQVKGYAGAMDKKKYERKTIDGETIVVDGCEFHACVITNCTLIYKGGELPKFERPEEPLSLRLEKGSW